MSTLLIMALNLIVGVCIGLTGIAGFLLPMFYTGFLNLPAADALALSFAAFLISGILGSFNYFRSGNLTLPAAFILSAGSLVGAIFGVKLNLLISEEMIKLILYLVVLLSGVSILVREWLAKHQNKPSASAKSGRSETIDWKSILLYLILGLTTGAVCAASGAGGPVLVMPLLTTLGFPAHMAVGIALFDSIFIAIPSIAGYFYAASDVSSLFRLLPLVLILHGAGVYAGSRYAPKINQNLLKTIVASASILIACGKLIPLLI